MWIPERFFRALSLLAALSSYPAFGQPISPSQFLPISAGVVRVEAENEHGGPSYGSGVTVAPFVIATNCHVVRDAVGIRISGSGSTWPVNGEHADTRRDLCFLRVPAWHGVPVSLAPTNALSLGSSVVALGFTGGVAISPKLGHIRGLHAFDQGSIIESDARFNSGSSGGGLFDSAGALIGLLTFRLRNSVESYYSLPVQWIREGMPTEGQWVAVAPLKGLAPFWEGEGVVPTKLDHVNDFPTQARVEFVMVCMKENPGSSAQEALYKCSCAVDSIAAKVSYETWVDLSTVANATTIAGERGGVVRDMKDGRKMVATFRELQASAKKGCFLGN